VRNGVLKGALWGLLIAIVSGGAVGHVAAEPPDKAVVSPLAETRGAKRLRRAVRKLLRRSPLKGVRVGIVVADAKTGQHWVRNNADKTLNPASTLKLFTSAAALDRLGPERRFETAILARDNTVYLRGTGDPELTMERFRPLVRKASRKLGSEASIGSIIVDTSAFAGGVLPPGFGKKNTDSSYRASTGAVALDWGTARIEVFATREGRKPRIVVTPPGAYVIVDNRARTVSGKGSTIKIRVKARGQRSVAMITGKIGRKRRGPNWGIRRIEHPPIMAGYALAALLKRGGVDIPKGVSIKMGVTPRAATLLAAHRSPPLSAIVADMNKLSNNFIAEMLLRGLVQPRTGPARWKAAKALVTRWLVETVGLKKGSFQYNNGSGLYDGGRFSPRQVVALLVHMNRHEHRQAYRDSLAVAGQDGTLANRLKGDDYTRRIIGKTGTLNSVSALSGYARNRKGRLLAFSIIMNDTRKATPQMRKIQDRICALIVDSH